MRGRFAAFLGALLVFAALVFTPAQAQSIRGIGAGGISAAVANGLYCQLIGCTMTGTATFNTAAPDIASATNTDLTLSAPGTGSVQLMSGDNSIDILDSAGTVRGAVVTSAGNARLLFGQSTNGGVFFSSSATALAQLGPQTNAGATVLAGCIGDTLGIGGGGVCLSGVYGEGIGWYAPRSALALATPTDSATSPVSGNAGSACRMSSTGVSAWTPQETGAVDGMFLCCTNTGTNVVTMTESAGVYEGPAVASAVGQFDTVCFEYVTDRWVQRSFSDN